MGNGMKWTVEVRATDCWTLHSTCDTWRDAVDQADMVHGRIVCPTGLRDRDAWQYAVRQQGFAGDYDAWTSLDDEERAEYEFGASGGTA